MRKCLTFLLLLIGCTSTNDHVKSILTNEFSRKLSKYEKLEQLSILKADGINLKQYCEFKLQKTEKLKTLIESELRSDSSLYKMELRSIKFNYEQMDFTKKWGISSSIDYTAEIKHDSISLGNYIKYIAKDLEDLSTCKEKIDKINTLSNSKDSLTNYGFIARVAYKIVSSVANPKTDTSSFLISKNNEVDFIETE